MRAVDLWQMIDECHHATGFEELRNILQAVIEHLYYRQQEHERERGL